MVTTGQVEVMLVSPHLDDAAFSAGATVAGLTALGHRVLLVTVFAGVPTGGLSAAARSLHRDCGLGDDAVLIRRREDRRAAGMLGASVHHLGFLDAMYRRRGAGGWLCERDDEVFDPELPAEPELIGAVATALLGLIRATGCRSVATCAGIGGHVDHRVSRAAVGRAARSAGRELVLWEDLPYALGRERPCGVARWPVPVPGAAWAAKWSAVAEYPSQLRMLWPAATWRAELEAHAARRAVEGAPGELMWRAGEPAALSSPSPLGP